MAKERGSREELHVAQTCEKSPFLGRLRPEKSTPGNPEYMSMGTSVVVLVVLLLKWYCLEKKQSQNKRLGLNIYR